MKIKKVQLGLIVLLILLGNRELVAQENITNGKKMERGCGLSNLSSEL
jgi:hypothetical protein